MRRAGSLLAVVVVVAWMAGLALAVSGRSSGSELPVIGCASRAEPSVLALDRRRDIVRGAFALVTVQRDLPRLAKATYRVRRGRLPGIKLPGGVEADHRASLRVARSQRSHVGLVYRHAVREPKRIADADTAVRFAPCAADTPAFSSDGVVGPLTGWAGALVLDGPRCVRLEVRVDGKRQRDIRLPLGRRCR
jgi:hypothetical protein